MATNSEAIVGSLKTSFTAAKGHEKPYPHWFMTGCVPEAVIDDINALPFPAPALEGISGKRELHNGTRKYFDVENRHRYPVCEAFAAAFQDRRITDLIQERFGTKLGGSYLRIEYAQDTNSFWLEPHTDLGVKVFTMLLYTSRDPAHRDLGTDIYDLEKRHVGRSPFTANGAMVFVPSKVSYHGFEARSIEGVRKSIIINYVTNEWRAREQLSFPSAPIG